jgi:hypothetical protein
MSFDNGHDNRRAFSSNVSCVYASQAFTPSVSSGIITYEALSILADNDICPSRIDFQINTTVISLFLLYQNAYELQTCLRSPYLMMCHASNLECRKDLRLIRSGMTPTRKGSKTHPGRMLYRRSIKMV